MERFETMLTGGHPNSLGRTIDVVEAVVANRSRLQELFECYQSADPVVRLRTSNALKRIEAARHDWLIPLIDPLTEQIGALDQASAQWTLAQLFLRLEPDMTANQRARATELMKRNLARHHDWIVLNMTMETLFQWSRKSPELKAWLKPHLDRLANDPRKTVAARARKLTALDNSRLQEG
jgi:hypothetical protein